MPFAKAAGCSGQADRISDGMGMYFVVTISTGTVFSITAGEEQEESKMKDRAIEAIVIAILFIVVVCMVAGIVFYVVPILKNMQLAEQPTQHSPCPSQSDAHSDAANPQP